MRFNCFKRYKIFFLLMLVFNFICWPVRVCRAETVEGDQYWEHSWFGAGGLDKTIPAGRQNVPLSEKENIAPDKTYKDQVPLFINSRQGKNDSLMFHYEHHTGQDAKGEWSYTAFSMATIYWQAFDVSKCDALLFYIKCTEGKAELKISISSSDKKQTAEVDINSFLPEGSITKKWQKVVVPFTAFPGIDKLDLSKINAFNGSGQGPADTYKIYIDNIIFFKTKPGDIDKNLLTEAEKQRKEREKSIKEAERKLKLEGKIEKELPKLKKTVLFDFDKSTGGWVDGSPQRNNITSMQGEMTEQGTGALRINMNLKKGVSETALAGASQSERDLTRILAVQFDAYLPSDGPKGLRATLYMMSDKWTK